MRINRDPTNSSNGHHTADHRSTANSSAPNNTDALEQAQRTIPEALKEPLTQSHELGGFLSRFVTAMSDSIELSLRNLVLSVILAAFGFVAIAGLIVIASWLILSGIAGGLGSLFDDRPWMGSFITGLFLLACLCGAMYATVAKRNKTARHRTALRHAISLARPQPQFAPNVAEQTIATRGKRGFLVDQAANSKTATVGTLRDTKDTTMRVADMRICAKQHPWLGIVGAVAAGFAAGAMLLLAPRNNITRTGSSAEAESQPIRHGQETPRSKKSRSFSIEATVLTGILRTTVKSWVTAAFVHQNHVPAETQSPRDSTDTDVPPRPPYRFRACSGGATNETIARGER